jgi:uncharacterized protein (TIGR03435 family)
MRRFFSFVMLRVVVAGAVCVLAVGQVNGQSNTTTSQAKAGVTTTYAYEVVSIKRPKSDLDSNGIGESPDGFMMRNLTLRALISEAYGVRTDEISGWPGWAASPRFDIEAKMDAETAGALDKLPKQQQRLQRQFMLQSLLVDRFNLKVHRATGVRTTYELVLAKRGPKIKQNNSNSDTAESKDGSPHSLDWVTSPGKISGHAMPLPLFISELEIAVDSSIVNKTGLSGRYDMVLKWDATDLQSSDSTEPSIFTALEEQLGLRLQRTKTTVETIVIDHLEMPSAN